MGLVMQKALGHGTGPKEGGEVPVRPEPVAKLPSVQQNEDFIQSSQWDNLCQLSTGKTQVNLSCLYRANFYKQLKI